MRARIKAMNYGLAYGLSAYGLSQQLKIEVSEAKGLMDEYFERFGNVPIGVAAAPDLPVAADDGLGSGAGRAPRRGAGGAGGPRRPRLRPTPARRSAARARRPRRRGRRPAARRAARPSQVTEAPGWSGRSGGHDRFHRLDHTVTSAGRGRASRRTAMAGIADSSPARTNDGRLVVDGVARPVPATAHGSPNGFGAAQVEGVRRRAARPRRRGRAPRRRSGPA